jgi:hypothetical protein
MTNEELTRSDIRSMIRDEISSRDTEKIVKDITKKVISNLYRTLWQRRSNWENDL